MRISNDKSKHIPRHRMKIKPPDGVCGTPSMVRMVLRIDSGRRSGGLMVLSSTGVQLISCVFIRGEMELVTLIHR
jgi:hypothetical protein